jgi:signal peptidase II
MKIFKTPTSKTIIYGSFLGIALLALDQISKWLVLHYQLPHLINQGVSFGIGTALARTYPCIVPIIVISIIGLLFYHVYKTITQSKDSMSPLYLVSIFLIISGAMGNLIDRYMYQGAIDFIQVIIAGYPFPIFNIADCCIVIGVFLFAVSTYDT